MIDLVVVGAGSRGNAYARLARASGRARIVGVAEPDDGRRGRFLAEHALPPIAGARSWEEFAERDPVGVAAIIATQDRDHTGPAIAFGRAGYHLLLEKPMAPTEAECVAIARAAAEAGVILAVCHVMRYTRYTRRLVELIAGGSIGEVASVEHLEPVGWWHQAHSFVRGNWRRADESSPMLMAKSVHDIDWLGYVIGRPVERVASFGSLLHFRPDKRPAGAGERCVDCGVEPACPYSARRLYLSCLGDPDRELWPLSVVTDARTAEGILDELASSPYGRCAYLCDNDVVDHQVVSLEYAGGITASFTMTAFTEYGFRRTRVFGSHGSIEGDGERLRLHDFRTDRTSTIDVRHDGPSGGGHGGGDAGLVDAFLRAVEAGDDSPILSGPDESLASHRVVWAAERARLQGTVVDLRPPADGAPGSTMVP